MKYANPHCELCGGEGVITEGARVVEGNIVDGRIYECPCVSSERAEAEADARLEEHLIEHGSDVPVN